MLYNISVGLENKNKLTFNNNLGNENQKTFSLWHLKETVLS